jgi:hypothetical protein
MTTMLVAVARAATLGKTRGRLNIAFAAVIFAVAIYMLVRAAGWF